MAEIWHVPGIPPDRKTWQNERALFLRARRRGKFQRLVALACFFVGFALLAYNWSVMSAGSAPADSEILTVFLPIVMR